MSNDLEVAIETVVELAITEGVSLSDLRLAIHDSYVTADIEESGESFQ